MKDIQTPSGWKHQTLGRVASINIGKTPPRDQPQYWDSHKQTNNVWLSIKDLTRHYISDSAEYIADRAIQELNIPIVEKNTVLLSFKLTIGKVGIARRDLRTNEAIAALKILNPDEIDNDFLYYGLGQWDLLQDVDQAIKGTTLNKKKLKEIGFVLPSSLVEQRQIADILSTLDKTIAQSESLVRKYQSIKQGLLSDLLTRGVDENGELRPSREEAPKLYEQTSLGCLPKKWEVLKIKDARKSITSGSRWWAKNYSEEGALFLRIGNLTREHINLRFDTIQRVRVPGDAESKRTAVAVGDVLVSVTADLGIIGVIPENFEEAYVNQHVALIKVDDGVTTSRWLGHYLASHAGQYQFQMKNDSGAKAGLNLPTVDSLSFANPPKDERDRIVEILDNHDETIKVERENLAKFSMLKQGLMQDLLSGQVRVGKML